MADRIPVLVGMTTLPSRIQHMKPCLESILNGTLVPDRIFVSLPQTSLREKTAYVIPGFFRDFADKVEIVRPEQDYGPGTKLLGMLGKITSPSYVVLADDDVTYKRFFLRRLIEHQRLDHNASFSFFTYSLGGLQVGQGVDGLSFWSPNLAGVSDFYKTYIAGTDLMFHDDLWISFFLLSRGVAMKSLRHLIDEAGAGDVRDAILHSINSLFLETGRLSRQNLNNLTPELFRRVDIPKQFLRELLTCAPDGPCVCDSGKMFRHCHGAAEA